MNIKKISVFQVDLPLAEGRYTWANGKFVETFDSTIVEIETHSQCTNRSLTVSREKSVGNCGFEVSHGACNPFV